MNRPTTPLFFDRNALDAEGSEYLASRFLSIPEAIKRGIASSDGYIHFAFTRNGELVRWKSRAISNKKVQTFSFLDDKMKETFKMPFFSQSKSPSCDYLIITEGEFDCVALSQLGASNCVSLPNGAASIESAIRNNYEFIQQFAKIYICTDMDAAGQEAAKKAEKLISPKKYRRINLPCKDANEWLMQNTDLEYADLQAVMENARCVDHPALTHVRDMPDDFFAKIDLGASSGIKRLDYILGGMRKGELTVISADTGSGKTTFSIFLLKNLADIGKGVWINSYEMDPKMINRKVASLVLKKKMKFEAFSEDDRIKYADYMKNKNFHFNVSNQHVNTVELRNLFEMAALVYGVEYLLLDHLDYLYKSDGKNTAEIITDTMREIHVLAMEFNMGVILIVHPKQVMDGKEITMSDLKGSSGIKQYADNIIIITRMDRVDKNDINRVKVNICKNRMCGFESSFFMRYLPAYDAYAEGMDEVRNNLNDFNQNQEK